VSQNTKHAPFIDDANACVQEIWEIQDMFVLGTSISRHFGDAPDFNV